MKKELQDYVWQKCSLPKEFKEEVKKEYKHQLCIDNEQAYWMLERIFGKHNLTSDAEGEEMLTCDKSIAQDMAKSAIRSIQIHDFNGNTIASQNIATFNRGVKFALETLFGSKCLPDDGDELSPGPKAAEPKFKMGDKVRVISTDKYGHIGQITKVEFKDGNIYYRASDAEGWLFLEKNLEHYAELTENLKPSNSGELESQKTCTQTFTDDASTFTDNRQSQCKSQSRNLSQETANCDTHSNNSLTDKKNGGVDHFVVERDMVKELRLTLAAQILGNIIKSGYYSLSDRYQEGNIHEIAKVSMHLTDALIAEAQLPDKLKGE